MANCVMMYRSAIIGDEMHQTTLAVAWRAADIYALDPDSVDAIAEAGKELCRSSAALEVAVLVAAVNDAACHLANTRLATAARPTDPTRWAPSGRHQPPNSGPSSLTLPTSPISAASPPDNTRAATKPRH